MLNEIVNGRQDATLSRARSWVAITYRSGNGTGHKRAVTLAIEGGECGTFVPVGDDDKAPGLQVAPVRRLLGCGETLFDDLSLDGSGEIKTFTHSAGGSKHLVDGQLTEHNIP